MSEIDVLTIGATKLHTRIENIVYTEAGEPFAIFDNCGSLVLFDLDKCKKSAAATDNNQASFIAKLCLALLDKSAEMVDFIQREEALGGCTYGDAIRNFNFMGDKKNG